jgi:hypothetical protein
MNRRPSRPARVLAPVLTASVLLACAACSDGGKRTDTSALAQSQAPSKAAATASATAGGLTEAQAREALIREPDLEDDWRKADDAASWRDRLLIGTVDVADFLTGKAQAKECQRLLDRLYAEDLLGKPSGASALTGFEEEDSRLLYQVASYRASDLAEAFDWLKELPDTCDEFTYTAAGSGGQERTVQVTGRRVPAEGDARQGLRVVVRGDVEGTPATLTLDVAAVRIGSDALTVTAGGLDGDEDDSVEDAVRAGARNLEAVRG